MYTEKIYVSEAGLNLLPIHSEVTCLQRSFELKYSAAQDSETFHNTRYGHMKTYIYIY